mmetsp:Transcript_99437/g.186828  ORF Transcript_99437/g.186828 Transcript_99437/m.186828 type:complete len:451 (+) Transcript_99437:92-1444(+)
MAWGGCHTAQLVVAWLTPLAASLRFAGHHEGRVVTPTYEELQKSAFQAAWREFQKTEGAPPPMPDPNVLYTLKEALSVRDRMKRSPGYAGLIPPILANEVAQLAANRFGYYPPLNGTTPNVTATGKPSLTAKMSAPAAELPEVPGGTSAPLRVNDQISPLLRKVPKPPACPAPLPELTNNDLGLALAPYKPADRTSEKAIKLRDGGLAWPLRNKGWYFQYPDMVLRMRKDGSTSIRWTNPLYAVDYDANGIVYYTGRSKVHRTISNDVLYQDPSGTVREEGDSLIYHWCAPNAIVYQTPVGTAYYDDGGVTFRSGTGTDVTHYAATGEVLYQGAGGITRHDVDGNVTHWTRAGAIFQHANGNLTYTPTGETAPRPLDTGALGPDPFPGPALTADDLPAASQENTTLSKKLEAAFEIAFSRLTTMTTTPAASTTVTTTEHYEFKNQPSTIY